LHELDDATIISELEAQGEEVMRQWSSLLNTAHMQEEADSNTANNNSVNSATGNNNNQATIESGCVFVFFACYLTLACNVKLVVHDASSRPWLTRRYCVAE